ncbi:MAG: flavin reductase family protein [Planctomycetes bacterium]|nr:flavin reductase family protein [Planctomycetota bacterium]
MAEATPEMQVLGRVPSGLYIVTAENGGQKAGFLASWVVQAGFMPPAITLAVKQDRPIMRQMARGALFALNILGQADKAIMGRFARGFEIGQDPFEGSNIERTVNNTPFLPDALGFMECRVLRVMEPSTEHNVISAEIIGGRMLKEGEPWVHVRKSGERY